MAKVVEVFSHRLILSKNFKRMPHDHQCTTNKTNFRALRSYFKINKIQLNLKLGSIFLSIINDYAHGKFIESSLSTKICRKVKNASIKKYFHRKFCTSIKVNEKEN